MVGGREERQEASDPSPRVGTELNRAVTCMVFKAMANDRCTSVTGSRDFLDTSKEIASTDRRDLEGSGWFRSSFPMRGKGILPVKYVLWPTLGHEALGCRFSLHAHNAAETTRKSDIDPSVMIGIKSKCGYRCSLKGAWKSELSPLCTEYPSVVWLCPKVGNAQSWVQ
ncbi:hypothetical protein TNCV_4365601 [Trichonephila clavipes]|nr:hypothetical protein TNCV_4365601 [Trichonephila clavipes]